jgi:hypothetical protein
MTMTTYENKTSNSMTEVSISEKLLFKKNDIEISEKIFWMGYILSGSVGNCKETIF